VNEYQTGINFAIPATINNLPLTVSEKIALTRIYENPRCRNAELAKLVAMTERGVKKLLRRLRLAGHIEQARKGRARRLYPTFHVEQGTKVLVPEKIYFAPKRELCLLSSSPITRKLLAHPVKLSLADEFGQTMRVIDEITRQADFFPETVIRMFQLLIERLEVDMPASHEKDRSLQELYARQGAFMAVKLAAKAPMKIRREFDRRISEATPDVLVTFRRRLVADELNEKSALLSLTRQ
jgi:hypothetical protein